MSKIVVYHFSCPENHLIEKEYEIQEGSTGITTVQVYCPDCDEKYSVEIDGRIVPDRGVPRVFPIGG